MQIFEGVVLELRPRRKQNVYRQKNVGDVAVERIFPVNSPSIEKVTLKAHSKRKIRQAKLYYLRDKKK